MKRKNWSRVLSVIQDIKSEMLAKGLEITYYHTKGETCLERWITQLNNPLYIEMFKYIQTSQKDDLVLIRYARYSDVFSNENDVTYHTFWDLHDGFYRQCRSTVIDVRNEVVVIAAPDKFFNINENESCSLDVVKGLIKRSKSVYFSNKLDSSFQAARYYNGKIIMSGSQAIDPDNSWRLQDGLRMLHDDNNYTNAIISNPNITFIFEYISLADAHVVNYLKEQEGLYLIGLRDSVSGRIYDYKNVLKVAHVYKLKVTELFDKNLDEVMCNLDSVPSNEAEGFVLNIVMDNGEMYFYKLKHLQYCAIHGILSNISSISLIIKNIADNTFDDLLSKVPEVYRWRVDVVSKVVFEYVSKLNSITNKYIDQIKGLELKEAMVWIQQNVEKEYRGYVIELYKGNEVNYLKSRNGSYKKMLHMGIAEEDYGSLFRKD